MEVIATFAKWFVAFSIIAIIVRAIDGRRR